MAKIDIYYHDLLRMIKDSGYNYTTENRPDITCKQISSVALNINLREGFPAITTKKLHWKSVVAELIWFLRGDGNVKFLVDNNVNIWNKDAYNFRSQYFAESPIERYINLVKEGHKDAGDVGKNYGVQWRYWIASNDQGYGTIDQISDLITNLRRANPISRRHIVTAWNPADLDKTALPPCHWAFEILPRPLRYFEKIEISGGDTIYLDALWKESEYKTLDKELRILGVPNYGFDLKWHQRSVDTFLGLPFNIASYGILAHLIGALTDMAPMAIIGDLSNVHLYQPHLEAVDKQLNNSPMAYKNSSIEFSPELTANIDSFKKGDIDLDELFTVMNIEDFILDGYESFDTITAEMFPPKE